MHQTAKPKTCCSLALWLSCSALLPLSSWRCKKNFCFILLFHIWYFHRWYIFTLSSWEQSCLRSLTNRHILGPDGSQDATQSADLHIRSRFQVPIMCIYLIFHQEGKRLWWLQRDFFFNPPSSLPGQRPGKVNFLLHLILNIHLGSC